MSLDSSSESTAGANGVCGFCGSPHRSAVETYKHRWLACDACGNIVREGRETYFAERIMPSSISKWLATTDTRYLRSLRMFFPRPVAESPESDYAYYQADLAKGVENTKYRGQYETYMALLARHGIDLTGRDVLDISGGPGFIAQSLSKTARRVVMTEYDPAIVKIARDTLGIETAHYNFNRDEIRTVVDGDFDFVFMRYAINFCLDVPKFLASLRQVIRPGADVFISFILPTMGACLRAQFTEDPYNVFFNPETMTRMFAEAGFRLLAREDESRSDYRTGASRLPRALSPAYEMRNRVFSGVAPVLSQDCVIQLYRYESPVKSS